MLKMNLICKSKRRKARRKTKMLKQKIINKEYNKLKQNNNLKQKNRNEQR